MNQREMVEAIKQALNECEMEFSVRRIVIEPKESFRKRSGTSLSETFKQNHTALECMVEDQRREIERLGDCMNKQNGVIAEKNAEIARLNGRFNSYESSPNPSLEKMIAQRKEIENLKLHVESLKRQMKSVVEDNANLRIALGKAQMADA